MSYLGCFCVRFVVLWNNKKLELHVHIVKRIFTTFIVSQTIKLLSKLRLVMTSQNQEQANQKIKEPNNPSSNAVVIWRSKASQTRLHAVLHVHQLLFLASRYHTFSNNGFPVAFNLCPTLSALLISDTVAFLPCHPLQLPTSSFPPFYIVSCNLLQGILWNK